MAPTFCNKSQVSHIPCQCNLLTLSWAIDVGLVKSRWGALAGPLGLPLFSSVNSSYVSSDWDGASSCCVPSVPFVVFLYLMRGSSSEESKESDDEPTAELSDEDPPDDRYTTVSASHES